jgi:hypothetical protein
MRPVPPDAEEPRFKDVPEHTGVFEEILLTITLVGCVMTKALFRVITHAGLAASLIFTL